MSRQPNRRAIVLSAFLTALILTVVAGGTVVSQRWLSGQAAGESADPPLEPPTPALAAQGQQTVAVSAGEGIAAYEEQLQQAYQALQEAYRQIEVLQAAQNRPAASQVEDDDEHDEHGRRSLLRIYREDDHDD